LVFAKSEPTNGAQDIGYGTSGTDPGTLSISGMSEVFLFRGISNSVTPTAPAHSIEPTTLLASAPMTGVGELYNFISPTDWEAAANSGYFIYRPNVSNPQTGQAMDYTWVLISVFVLLSLGGLFVIKSKK